MRPSFFLAAILGFVGFVTSFGAHIVAVNLPVYAEQVGVGIAAIGILIAVYDFAEILGKPLFGALADRQGMKRTMLAGIVVFILSSLAFLIVDPRLLILIRFLQGAGAAALSAVSLALVGVYFDEQHRGRAYGIYNTLKGAGYVISPLIGGVILVTSHFSTIFLASAVVGALALLLAAFLPATGQQHSGGLDEDDEAFSLSAFLAVFREPRLRPWYAITIVNMFFVGILFGFLPVLIHDAHYSALQSGVLLAVTAASYLLIQPLAGWLADLVDPSYTIRVGLALAGISLIVLPFTQGIFLVLLSILAGIGVGTVWTNTDALVSRLATAGKLGATMGAAGSFKEFGDMLGPILIGLIAQAFSLPTGFVACGILGLLAVPFIRARTKSLAV